VCLASKKNLKIGVWITAGLILISIGTTIGQNLMLDKQAMSPLFSVDYLNRVYNKPWI